MCAYDTPDEILEMECHMGREGEHGRELYHDERNVKMRGQDVSLSRMLFI